MKKYLSTFLIIPALLVLILISSCKKNNPVIPPIELPKAVSLSLVDVSCTEAFIRVSTADSLLPLNITLSRDDSTISNFTLTQSDTVVIDTTLQPDHIYTYQTTETINGTVEKSDTLQVRSLIITSNNFTWQTFTFGDPAYGSSKLNDVAIIDENNIWAVGEIYNDTTGQAYNAVHWDGQSWELKRIMFYGICGQSVMVPYPAKAVFTMGNDTVWIAMDGDQITRLEGGVETQPLCLPSSYAINKMWGRNNEDFYLIGNGGNITHYKNRTWTDIKSGTTTDINDIWGNYDASSGKESVLCVASNILHQGEYRLFSISGGISSDTLNWPYTNWLKGVWFKNQYSPVYICGSGVKMYKNNIWSEINLPNYFTEAIRGSDYNNIFVVGDFGTAAHFNGMEWQTINELAGIGEFLGVAIKGNTTVICGYNSNGVIVGSGLIVVGKR